MSASDITAEVLDRFDGSPDARVRELMRALVSHLHGFAQAVELTQAEWEAGIRFLTEAGEITDERRQEFILLSDTLGLSMVVDALEDVELGTTTESTVLGPFWADGAPSREYGENMAEHPAGEPAWVHGHVRDVDGQPISGVELDVWQNAENGLYAMQDPDAPEHHLRGRFRTRADGSYGFVTVRPAPYEVPTDGPVGRMLHANDRAAWRPGHIHIIVTCEGFERLVTHIFDADPVFCVKPSLLRTFVARRADDPEKPAGVEGAWHSVANDLVLRRAHSE